MNAAPSFLPESLGYLPAVFRTEIERETQAGGRQDPVRALLQNFEGDLHLAERVVEHSHRWFDPALVTGFAQRAAPPYFFASDFVDPIPLAVKLVGTAEEDDPVAKFLRLSWLADKTRELLARVAEGERSAGTLDHMLHALAADLNRALRGAALYAPERFAHVRFSLETKRLLGQSPRGGDGRTRLNRLLLQDAYPREIAALPAAPRFLAERWEREFLQWLASWLGLELDREWFDPAESQGGEAPAERDARAKGIIGEIAGLYRLRGTCEGFCRMAKALLGLDVQILERTWPRGMEIGRHSSIGIETLLVEKPDLDRQFTLLIPLTPENRGWLPAPARGMEISLLGPSDENNTAWFPEPDEAPAAATPADPAAPAPPDVLREWTVRLNKLNRLIEQNKPAHIRCFLAFTRPEAAQKSPTPPMVIGETSTVGNFLIE